MKNYDDKLEKNLTAVFGAVGALAVIINLFVKGLSTVNFLDALKDIAGLVVVIAVFLIARKIFKSMSYTDFRGLFEKYLKEWVNQNRFLIDVDKQTEQGKDDKEFYFMLTKKNHKNIVFQEKPASKFDLRKGASDYDKGAFLYTDTNEKQEIIIGINKSLFLGSEYQDKLEDVALKLKDRIIDFSKNFEFIKKSNKNQVVTDEIIKFNKNQFADDDIKISENSHRLVISIKDIDKSEGNAKLLIDMLEYIKTMILALA